MIVNVNANLVYGHKFLNAFSSKFAKCHLAPSSTNGTCVFGFQHLPRDLTNNNA